MKPSEIINYLQHLAEDFELNQRHSEAIYVREAAALVASHTTREISRLTMTIGDEVFDMIAPKPIEVSNALFYPEERKTTWERQAEKWKAIAAYLAMGLENNCRYGLTKDAQNALEQFREAMS